MKFSDKVMVKLGISFYSGCTGVLIRKIGTDMYLVRFSVGDGSYVDREFKEKDLEEVK